MRSSDPFKPLMIPRVDFPTMGGRGWFGIPGLRVLFLWSLFLLVGSFSIPAKTTQLLNVSYDPTREFYVEFNAAFAKDWKTKTGEDVRIAQSHGGSGKQARAVIEGLDADVVTLALGYDIDVIAKFGKLLEKDWQGRLPEKSSPYTSTVVFIVRSGNPHRIQDWADLAKPEVEIIMANPKTSGGARWNYLAAYGAALKRHHGDESAARKFLEQFLSNIPVLDSGARGATTTFVQRSMGDVLVAWENEALLVLAENRSKKLELIRPAWSILAEPPVAVVDRTVKKRGTQEVAEAYLKFLYSEIGQELCAKHYFRPRLGAVLSRFQSHFPLMQFFSVDEMFGGWENAHKRHFSEGGVFDQISAEIAGRSR